MVVVLDSDRRDCADFLVELKALAASSNAGPNTLFRIAIEEMEAWYLAKPAEATRQHPKAKVSVLQRYTQDSVCGTWELLADAVPAAPLR